MARRREELIILEKNKSINYYVQDLTGLNRKDPLQNPYSREKGFGGLRIRRQHICMHKFTYIYIYIHNIYARSSARRHRSAVAQLLLSCCSAVAQLLLSCCSAFGSAAAAAAGLRKVVHQQSAVLVQDHCMPPAGAGACAIRML